LAGRLRAGRPARLYGLAVRAIAVRNVKDVDIDVDRVVVVGNVEELHRLVDHVQRLVEVIVLLAVICDIGVRDVNDALRQS